MPIYEIPPTWQYATGFGNSGDVTWSVYRYYNGNVSMRLTDVAGSQDPWWKVVMDVWLLDHSGVTRGSGTLTKFWGVTPGFTHLASMGSAGRSLRLRTRLTIHKTDWGLKDPSGTWRAQIQYG